MSSVSISLYQPHRIDDVYKKIQIEADIFASFESGGSPKKAIEEMYNFFLENNLKKEIILSFYDSYWKWFVRICYTYTQAIDPLLFPNIFPIICAPGTSMGFSSIDMYVEYMSYIRQTASDEVVQKIHTQSVHNISNSVVSLNYEMSRSMSTAELYSTATDDLEFLDSLQKADFLSRIQEELFEKNSLAIFLDTKEKIEKVTSLFQFLQFLHNTKDIILVITSFDRKKNAVLFDKEFDERVRAAVQMEEIIKDLGFPDTPAYLFMRPFNFFEYLDEFEKKNIDGTYRPDIIIAELDSVANDRNEPRIRDVYYYNEVTGKFEWDEALLKELELVPKDFDMSTVNKKD